MTLRAPLALHAQVALAAGTGASSQPIYGGPRTNAVIANSAWPMRGHDAQHTGRSPYTDVGPFLIWKGPTGSVAYSSPAIGADGTIYVGSETGSVYALDGSDGSVMWSHPTGGVIESSPAIDADGTVYVGSSNGSVYALDGVDGGEKWRYPTGDRVYASPAIGADGTIYVASYDYSVYALDSADGSLIWSHPTGEFIFSSPAIGVDGTIYVGSGDGSVYALNAADGSLKWSYPTGGSIYSSSPAIAADGTLYVGSTDGSFYALNGADGSLKWSYPTGGRVDSSPAIGADGTVYVGLADGTLRALNGADGSLKWSYSTGGNVLSLPAIGSDGTIYVGSEDGSVYALNGVDGSLKWSYPTGGPVFSSAAIGANGGVYVGSGDGFVYAIGIPAGQGGVEGGIRDLTTSNSIDAATISAAGTTTESDTRGAYSMTLAAGTYDVTCSKEGYQSVTISNLVITAGEATHLDIELTTPGLLNIVTTNLPAAETAVAYDGRVKIAGGTGPYVYSIVYGTLPPGLSLDAGLGHVAGAATETGSYTFAVAVTDSLDAYAEQEFTLEVSAPLEIVGSSPLPRGTQATPYFLSLYVVGGALPYSFSLSSGSLPPGLSLATNGNLSGVPSSTNAYDFAIGVSDGSGRTAEKTFHLEIDEALVVTTSKIEDGMVGSTYEQVLAATGGSGTYRWAVHSGALPTGLSLDPLSGTLSGTPTEGSYGTLLFSVSDEGGRIQYKGLTLRVASPLQMLTNVLPAALVNAPFFEMIRLAGGIGPFICTASGQLPSGLFLDSASCTISGRPSISSYTNLSLTVSDSAWPTSQSVTKILGLRARTSLTITTSAVLSDGNMGVAASPVALTAGGGPPPYGWALVSGSIPVGMGLDRATGVLSGRPNDQGDFAFTIEVTDAHSATATKEFFWHVSVDASIVTGSVPAAAEGSAYNFALEAEGGIAPYSWSVGAGSLPQGLAVDGNTGVIAGTPEECGAFNFTLWLEDSASPPHVATRSYDLDVQCRNAVVLNGGGLCSAPGNLIGTARYANDDVYVRNANCPPGGSASGAEAPCPAPGAATQVCLVSGGFVGGDLLADDTSSIQVTGGAVGGALYARGASSSIEIHGRTFMIDGTPVAPGEISALTGVLSGQLQSGDPLNNSFHQLAAGQIHLVPEPATSLLEATALMALIGLAARRRRLDGE